MTTTPETTSTAITVTADTNPADLDDRQFAVTYADNRADEVLTIVTAMHTFTQPAIIAVVRRRVNGRWTTDAGIFPYDQTTLTEVVAS